jgi:hypothetical protein
VNRCKVCVRHACVHHRKTCGVCTHYYV